MTKVLTRPRPRILVAVGCLLAALVVALLPLPPVTTPAAAADGGAENSAVTKAGTKGRYDDFSRLKVTVHQTKGLRSQGVRISWEGGAPTEPSTKFNVNYLQIMQCWGDDPAGPDREQCAFGATDGVGAGSGRVVRYGPNQDPQEDPKYVTDAAHPEISPFVPFRPANGEPPTKSSHDFTYFSPLDTNERSAVRTFANGTGESEFEVQDGIQSDHLGCGVNTASAGSAPAPRSCCTASLTKADNPGLDVRSLAGAITGDGTYELRVRCVDNQSSTPPSSEIVPGDPYWTQKITVTGDNWVVGEGAKATSLQLTHGGNDVEPGKEITFTATVAPAEAAGTVTFKEGETTLGEAPVANGKAEFKTSTLSEGQHRITAQFTPANSAEWGASTAAPVELKVQPVKYELLDASGERLALIPELQRGQTVKLIVRRCQPDTSFDIAMDRNDTDFPSATSDPSGTVTWPALTVPDDAVEGNTAWLFSPGCAEPGGGTLSSVGFKVPAPSSESPSDDPSDNPSDDPTDDPTGDPTDDPTTDPSGDTSGTTAGDSGTSGDSGSGGTSPSGGLASTGSQIALFSGIGAVVLTGAGIAFVRFGRRNGLLNFGDPRP